MLEDGTVFTGASIGSQHEVINGIVFDTSMTGYLEALTDPSYAGQAIVTTYPLVSGYRICHEDMESAKPWPDGYIVRGLSRIPSNSRNGDTIQNFLKEHDISGINGADTRALTKILREKGAMNGMITVEEYTDLSEPTERMKKYSATDVVLKASIKEKYVLPGHSETPGGSFSGVGKGMALTDYDAEKNIAHSLNSPGCKVAVHPTGTPAKGVLAAYPDGTMLSNGPGDPKENTATIEEIKKLYISDIPTFAICLGHQLMVLVNGTDTYRLEYGRRGGNHPVKDLETRGVYVSSQNHGCMVGMGKVNPEITVPAFVNVNDGTSEGLRYVGESIFMVQYHPEAYPGSLDFRYLFGRFLKVMEVKN